MYQNPNVCFDLDFIAQQNAFLQAGSSFKNGIEFKLRNNIYEVSLIKTCIGWPQKSA